MNREQLRNEEVLNIIEVAFWGSIGLGLVAVCYFLR